MADFAEFKPLPSSPEIFKNGIGEIVLNGCMSIAPTSEDFHTAMYREWGAAGFYDFMGN